MASSIFSPLERERLDNFPLEIRAEDLAVYFRLSEADLFEIRDLRGPTNQFGFALQLCALRFLGFSPKRILQAPLMARLYVVEQLGLNLAQVNEYGLREQTRTEHAGRAQQLLKFRTFDDTYKQELLDWLTDRALEHDEPRILLEMVLQKLKAQKIIRPGISLLERLVFTARDQAGERTYLGQRYSHIREFAPVWLEALPWRSNLAARPLLEGIDLLRRMNREKLRNVPAHAPEAFISARWEPYVYEKNGSLNRKYYELCILWELRQALRGSNIWVEGARRYAPLSKHLIQTSEWAKVRLEAHNLLNLPVDGAERIQLLETEITAHLAQLEKLLTEPTGDPEESATKVANKAKTRKGLANVRLESGQLVVSRLEAVEIPASTRRLRQLVGQKLPRVELIDLIMETDRWVNFSQTLIHAGAGKPCTEEQRAQLYAALVAQGCNLGLSNMSRMSSYTDNLARRHWASGLIVPVLG